MDRRFDSWNESVKIKSKQVQIKKKILKRGNGLDGRPFQDQGILNRFLAFIYKLLG